MILLPNLKPPTFTLLDPPKKPTAGDYLSGVAGHPFTLGAVVGLVNGALAYRRDQFISTDVLAALALPTVLAEGYLHYRATAGLSESQRAKRRSLGEVMIATGIGLVVGAALFTRWNPSNRALIESAQAPAPRPPTTVFTMPPALVA